MLKKLVQNLMKPVRFCHMQGCVSNNRLVLSRFDDQLDYVPENKVTNVP